MTTQWADIWDGGYNGEEEVAQYNSTYPNGDTDSDCLVTIHIKGDDERGYILFTRDNADGPSDDAGRTVYSTENEAREAAERVATEKDEPKVSAR